ncbi:hypothetical protein [Siccirubricoccus phaeus]|uniref:hypothetical protein n=1 Tax=Siccirubricoccus phaeus TaxID=2595053 RepID=UPI0011F1B95F|nr:hypothetical protein [Siccirubricoccus phaeus]
MLGGVAGYALGVAGQPPQPRLLPVPEAGPAAPSLAEAPAPRGAAAGSDAAAPGSALETARESLATELATLRTALAEETDRLAEAMLARSEAEAQLALLRRRLAGEAPEAPDPAPETAPPASASAPAREPPQAADPPREAAPRREPAAYRSPRVFLHFPAGAAEAATGTAALLRDAGFELGEMRAVTAAPAHRVVRYFHAADAAAAARLAGRLGRGWAIQDFRGYEPAPPQQTLELWLPDR